MQLKSLSFFAVVCAIVVSFTTAFMAPSPQLSAITSPSTYSRTVGNMNMMRHGKRVAKLGKPADQRKALLRSLTTEVIRHGRITTTLVRAKAVRKYVDKMIGLAKRGTLHTRRQALGWLYDETLVTALFEQAPERYSERNGGYCRVLRTMPRKGDNAPMGIIELV